MLCRLLEHVLSFVFYEVVSYHRVKQDMHFIISRVSLSFAYVVNEGRGVGGRGRERPESWRVRGEEE